MITDRIGLHSVLLPLLTVKNFKKFRVALNPSGSTFLNFAKIVSKHANYSMFHDEKWGSQNFFSHNCLKVKLGLFLTGYNVAMVAHYVEKMTITCLPMFRHLSDAIIVALTDKEWKYLSVKV